MVRARGRWKKTVAPEDVTGTGVLAAQISHIHGSQTQGFIVDEVSDDADLKLHPEIVYYSDMSGSIDSIAHSTTAGDWNGKKLPADPANPSVGFYGGIYLEKSTAAPFNQPAIRNSSPRQPDRYISPNTFDGNGFPLWETHSSPNLAPSESGCLLVNLRKYTRSAAGVPSGANKIGTASYFGGHFRWLFMIERDVLDYMTENAMKLSGQVFSVGAAFASETVLGTTMWMRKKLTGATRWMLSTYWRDSGSNFAAPSNIDLGEWIYPDVWHCLEQEIWLNSPVTASNGFFRGWFDDKLIWNYENINICGGVEGGELGNQHIQMFHGGQIATPLGHMHTRHACWAFSNTRRIGRPKLVTPQLTQDLNNGLWTSPNVEGSGWAVVGTNGSQRVDMNFSSCHQATDGRQIEFSVALHSRSAGDNTGVKWAEFDSTRPPKQGYYWPNNDLNLAETDNGPTAYLPWKNWVLLSGSSPLAQTGTGQKIIDISGTPSAVYRNNDGSGDTLNTYLDVVYPTGAGLTALTPASSHYISNLNPACWVNPTGTKTGWWGGGYGTNFPSGQGSIFKLIDDNPNYPTSPKPIRIRIFRPTGAPSPTQNMRYMVEINGWLYWGGCSINYDNGTAIRTDARKFFRINVADLNSLTFTQEQITDGPEITFVHGITDPDMIIRANLLCADTVRNWLIYINVNGVYRYKVPADNGNDGTWDGPFTFGLADWADTISQGNIDSAAKWQGCIGTHRADLGQGGMTFFRYNLNRQWNRIEWPAT